MSAAVSAADRDGGRDARRAPVRDVDELVPAVDDPVKDVVPLALELNDVALLELLDVGVRERFVAELRDGGDEVLDVVVLLELLLRDEVVVVEERHVDGRRDVI